jgi:hypothetical protein
MDDKPLNFFPIFVGPGGGQWKTNPTSRMISQCHNSNECGLRHMGGICLNSKYLDRMKSEGTSMDVRERVPEQLQFQTIITV